MKIIAHKTDNTAYEKRVNGCVKFAERDGIDFYYTEGEGGTRKFYCRLVGTRDILKLIVPGESYATPEEIAERIEELPEQQLKEFCTVKGELARIETACENGTWTSNADIYFCELMGKSELAKRARTNRAAIYKQQDREGYEEEQRQLAEQRAYEAKEREEQARWTEQAEQSLRSGNFISSFEFELLAKKYGVKLHAKFVGWLREHCGSIRITQHKKELPQGLSWANKYETYYHYDGKSKSKSIYAYADALAEAVGL